jgi:predicted HicB family RNase H-like nuclease
MTKGYEQRKKSNEKYLATLDEIKVRVPKGAKETIKSHAESRGESVNGFINRAINETIERDKQDRE